MWAENEVTVADLHIPSRTFSIKEWIILILSCITFSTLKYWEKWQIFVWFRSDYKIADSYLIGYNHVLWRRYESASFDVLWSVGISLIFKILLAQVQYSIFWISCSEIHENELIKNILKKLILQIVLSESKGKT